MNTLYLLSLLTKYEVQLLAYSPGEVTVKIASLSRHRQKVQELIEHLRTEEAIYSIDIAEDIVTIQFDSEAITSKKNKQYIYSLIERFNL